MNVSFLSLGSGDGSIVARTVRIGFFVVAFGALGWTGYAGGPEDVGASQQSHAPADVVVSGVEGTALQEADGEQIYNSRCATCHQANGQGVPGVFPPLTGTHITTGEKGGIVRVVLHGLSGEIEVDGQTYSGSMPPWGSFLSNEEVAAVVTYVRQNFGNDASEVSADEVEAVRQAHSDRSQPWTADELSENMGIPGQDSGEEGDESGDGDESGEDGSSGEDDSSDG